MRVRMLTAIAALPIAAVSTFAFAGSASATGDGCYENRGDHCEEPTPVPQTYNLIVGTRFADTIFGTNDADAIFGRKGNDTIVGRDGGDLLFGNRGRDRLVGGDGEDRMRGGVGYDTCVGTVEDVFLSCENVIITA